MPRWFARRGERRADADAEWSRIQAEIVRAKDERIRLVTGKESFVADLEAILFRHDPIGINFDDNTDEYRPEAETIAIRLPEARDERDLVRIVHEEFVRWFDASIAGDMNRYREIVHEIWLLHQAP
jgi:hypothetical protein